MKVRDSLAALGIDVHEVRPIAGGDTTTAFRAEGDDGPLFVKTARRAAPGMFPAEAAGLEWLREAGVLTPTVVGVDENLLVLSWIEEQSASEVAAIEFGRQLARAHSLPAPAWGCAPDGQLRHGWVGAVQVPYGVWPSFAEFLADGRLRPALAQSVQRGHIAGPDIGVVESLCDRLADGSAHRMHPPDEPGHVHGDLWSGNLLWQRGNAMVIDPSAHGGHPETDLAMLSLFGAPHLGALISGYQQLRPLAPDWQDWIPLHQVFPLLVHATMFGGGYGARAGQSARAALSVLG